MTDFGGRSLRRFSSSGRSRMLESETILLEKKLAEMRTVRQVDREQMDSRLISKSSKFIWQGGRSGKLRQFKYGKKKNEPMPPTGESGRLQPRAPSRARHAPSKDQSEKENQRTIGDRPLTPPKVQKETHSMECDAMDSTPITEEDLRDPHELPKEEAGLWFPGASFVPQAPEKHEISVGTDQPKRGKSSFESAFLSTRRREGPPREEHKDGQKPLVNSYFAKLYLAKSLQKDKAGA
ncbi:hypothetical protein HKI87_01g02430 [Chloropicon roscoffensis]|uniref:Uncharacterized protein n=1 Tax=Chloropicon roscoffensis TaxID=1461544 RepID=A0AAX4NYM5_9CHLO